ncbi:hypothetical protein AB205_0015800 [Aquarana catesbeiana]|uniref:Uncharacterized protein n=1 Tax=Aquarana catesbeiana TaxID=8400 RepID=A0A2G9PH54_AQUCT|nr:hypothetical protein AB205_0015800 [Aquarana catesbeiana]PIO02658.1 hypothetical protein AB205_0015800 [Aquarana catesbeiana]
MRSTVSSVPARARRASSSPENDDADPSQETNSETVSSQDYQPVTQEPAANLNRRVRSTSTTHRTCRTQQESPFEEYFDCIIKEMRNQSQNPATKDDEFLNISDPYVIFLRMLLCVVREIPPDKRTEVRGDIHACLTYIVSACKEPRPYPRFQPWGLGFNTPSGSLNKPMQSHQYHETTPAMNPYAGPPPTYTPFPSHLGFQRMHVQPHPVSSPPSSQSGSPIDVGSEPRHSSLRSPYPVYENL